ncbi:siroheme decarboxylase subunit beta [Halococcoides cellulosivorans]|uniref:siroheme decarboxylase n=1 Tax=Halococcoides cellulosivorans TaxID=1679096 RepID=A0A2R4X0K3_9EURY|nr:Lrp/AsnC family transcriptional regulator [Halococcoides cellulosivorans]AWB27291.1 Lrp/AsnC family transcriptional regulator [Halococcoides cellulosivorans]
MTDGLDRRDAAIVNAFQGGFPVTDRPFEVAADALAAGGVDLSGTALREHIADLVERGTLSRFGPLIDADAIGGRAELVAMAVPADRFDAVAEAVNAHEEVSHNYRRDHDTLTMWLVVSAADPDRIEGVTDAIEAETGLRTYRLPKLTEFHVGARFPVEGPFADGGLDLTDRNPGVAAHDGETLTADERELLLAIQDGLPIEADPYVAVADDIGAAPAWVRETIEAFRRAGVIRRIGAVPNHYALGYSENGMTVWDVPDDSVEEIGTALADLPFVTHCYERPRHDDVWPYNVFAMVHGRSEVEIDARLDRVRAVVAAHARIADDDWATLYSTEMLKKTGFSLADRTEAATNS